LADFVLREANFLSNKQEIEKIKNIIVETANPELIYLFGSYAYGTPNADSDYDFYVVVPDDSERPLLLTQSIYRALYHQTEYNKSVDILIKRLSDFEGRKSLPTIEREVYQKGVVLYGNA
jgi:predicted nucleotidyltransferase